jgi:hypothetical protein
MKETAVQLLKRILEGQKDEPFDYDEWCISLEYAEDTEKEQIIDAFVECWKLNVPDGIECKLDAEQYYNETFKSE